ncbi:hypothetical protein BJX99DRAFT_257613 [Aspergillus californicus]
MLLLRSGYGCTDTILHVTIYFGDRAINVGLAFQRTAYKFVLMSTKAINALKRDATGPQLESNGTYCNLLLRYTDDLRSLDLRVGEAIRSLRQDPWMDRVYQCPREFGIPESVLELFNDIDRIASPNYEPTSKDMQVVQGRTPVVIELKGTYIKHLDAWNDRPEGALVRSERLDITL